MNVSLYESAAALNATARWQEMIAENLASSSIPGFKKQELSFAAIQGGLLSAPTDGPQHFALPQTAVGVNFRQGDLRSTGVKTDMALDGRGFFAVQMPDGTTGYTRDGEFHVDSTGQLVTKQGHPVLGDGSPIQIDLNNRAEMTISPAGQVSQGNDVKGSLRPVNFNNPALLVPVSQGYFLARNPSLQVVDPEGTTVRQGFLEAGNTSAPAEMVKLISAMRLFEANQRALQAHDDRMGKTIAEIGMPS
jgi:flagellar basal body rod protein FlgG